MKVSGLYFLCAILLLMYGCRTNTSQIPLPSPVINITCAPGPEDLALDTFAGHHRIIISANQRRVSKGEPHPGGKLQYLDLLDESVHDFELINYRCGKIYPHGIDLARWKDSMYLFVISHHPKNTDSSDYNHHLIHQFLIGDRQLFWRDSFSSPLLRAPNDLFVCDDGRIYVSNYMKRISTFQTLWTALLRFKSGTIAYLLPESGWHLAEGRYGYPNGVFVQEQLLYIAEGTRKRILRFNLDDNGNPLADPIQSVHEFLFADNLMQGPEGWLYGTCHPKPLQFKQHAGNALKKSPSWIYRISPDLSQWEWLGKDDGQLISAASTCLPYQNHLYLSQVFDDFILRVPSMP